MKSKIKSHCDYVMHISDLQKCESLTISSAEETDKAMGAFIQMGIKIYKTTLKSKLVISDKDTYTFHIYMKFSHK